jgi:tetratricopeptide (TPR) repeat protein
MASQWEQLGDLYCRVNRYHESVKASREAIRLNPNELIVRRQLAEALKHLGQTEEALSEYKYYFDSASNPFTRSSVAEEMVKLCQREDELERLLSEYEPKLKEEPDAYHLHFLLGLIHNELGNEEVARKAFKRAMEIIQEKALQQDIGRFADFCKRLEMDEELITAYETRLASYESDVWNKSRLYDTELIPLYIKTGKVDKVIEGYEYLLRHGLSNNWDFSNAFYQMNPDDRKVTLQRIKDAPEHPILLMLMAKHYRLFFDQDKEAALNALKRAVELAPNDADTHNALGTAYFDQKDYANALKCYQRAYELSPEQPLYRLRMAYAYNGLGEHEKALDIGESFLSEMPDDADAHAVYGAICLNAGKYDDAVCHLEKASELTGSWSNRDFLHFLITMAHDKAGRYKEADALVEKTQRWWTLRERVNLYRERKDGDGLLRLAKLMREGAHDQWYIHDAAFRVLAEQNRLGELRDVLEEVKDRPGSKAACGVLAEIYSKEGRKEEAIAMYEKALSVLPDRGGLYNGLAGMYENLSMFGKAISVYDRAITQMPGYEHGYWRMAILCNQIGDKENARKLIEKIKRHKSWFEQKNVDIWATLGEAYTALEEYDKAEKYFKEALEQQADYKPAQEGLAKLKAMEI